MINVEHDYNKKTYYFNLVVINTIALHVCQNYLKVNITGSLLKSNLIKKAINPWF